MDYPAAIAIAIPTSTFIVMVGTVIKSKRNNPGNQKDFIERKEFVAVTGGITNELKLTRESLLLAIKNLGEEVRGMKHGPD